MPHEPRPNILIITTDQQWAGAMSCAGNPDLHTPAMDSLAERGMRFDAAYVANPICVPSRTSYMTGTHSHQNGVFSNVRRGDVPVSVPCLARVFRDHGYDTAHIGKWHIPRPLEDRAWSGFDTIEAPRDNRVDFDIPEPAIRFIETQRATPFFLVASFVNPHDVCEFARRLSGIPSELPNGEIGDPPPAETCPPMRPNHAIPDGEPAVIREHQNDSNMHRAYPTRNWADNDPRWRQYLWCYYRLIEKVDAQIGVILDALRRSGQEENTLVLFTSDHGDGMGAHRWNQKTLFYDEVARVPFIVSWKGRTLAGACNRKHLVNLGTDLFPTLFDFAGIEQPAHLTGVSAARVARGETDAEPRPCIVAENNHHHGFGVPGEVHGRMVRSMRYKYVRYNRGSPSEQLFDLHRDPHELRDLTHHGDAREVLADHRRMLDDHIRQTGDFFPLTTPTG